MSSYSGGYVTRYSGGSAAFTRHSTRTGKTMKGKVPLTLILAAAGAAGVIFLMKPKEELVTGRSGKRWRVVLRGTRQTAYSPTLGPVKEWEVFAPASSWGPHPELSVLRYEQTGSDMSSRKITGVGAGVPVPMMEGAAADFGLPFDSSKVLPPGGSGR